MVKKLSKLIATLAIPFLLTPTLKAEMPSMYIYFNEGQSAYHPKQPEGGRWNENNKLRGLGVELYEDIDVFIKKGINSHGIPSTMIGFNYKTCNQDKELRTCYGGSFGTIDGYPRFNGNPSPMITGYGGLEYKNIGIECHILPHVILWNYKFKF